MIPFAVIIPAGGTGSRAGGDVPKQYVELDGVRVLERTLAAFIQCEDCIEIVVAVDDAWRDVATACARADHRVRLARAGAERQSSIALALEALTSDARIVLVHDAARPCVRRALIDAVVVAASEHGAAVPVLAVAETVKRVDELGAVVETVPRGPLRLAQTPQGFERKLLERAYAHAAERDVVGTDDASLVEMLGAVVMTVPGDPDNIKITVAQDFTRAATTLRSHDA